MKIVIYGLAITSSWGNGHATTYRSLCKALARRGHQIHFVEKNVEWFRDNRDMPHPEFCKVHLYTDWLESERNLVRLSKDADAVVVGSYFPDALAATEALLAAGCGPLLFYDIDTPITISRLRAEGRAEYITAEQISHFSAYLSFTGGPVLREIEERFNSPCAVPFYCSVDPELYRPKPVMRDFECALSYLGTHASDRQPKLMNLLNGTAELMPESRFIVAGAQYPKDTPWAKNVERITHLSPPDHPSFYCSSKFTLNLTRDEMVAAGYSPSVRLFEASACGAAIVSDYWKGLEHVLTPNQEVLLPKDAYEVAQIIRTMPDAERTRMGLNARERILSAHTAAHRAIEFEQIVNRCSGTSARVKEAARKATKGTGPVVPEKALRAGVCP
ncbi:CgeB family protein [Occallatibacter savannae]|uniref:CgeB family protein n=1 Tax=Occallatibacter savannae TaxID=1002691 RepID=UPI000D68F7BB|nr:glycosyltransferase [Occallatibacter savannae]